MSFANIRKHQIIYRMMSNVTGARSSAHSGASGGNYRINITFRPRAQRGRIGAGPSLVTNSLASAKHAVATCSSASVRRSPFGTESPVQFTYYFQPWILTESALTNPVESSLLIVPRWRGLLALNLKLGADGFHPITLVHSRQRLLEAPTPPESMPKWI